MVNKESGDFDFAAFCGFWRLLIRLAKIKINPTTKRSFHRFDPHATHTTI